MEKKRLVLTLVALCVCSFTFAQFTNTHSSSNNSSRPSSSFDGNGTRKGYQGFVEVNYAISGDYGAWSAFTTHGVQINPYFFVGAGVGVEYTVLTDDDKYDTYDLDEQVFVPFYGSCRWNILNKRISPIIDAKVGYSPFDAQGFFAAVNVGCRFRLGTHAIIPSVGWRDQTAKYNDGDSKGFGFCAIGVTYEF